MVRHKLGCVRNGCFCHIFQTCSCMGEQLCEKLEKFENTCRWLVPRGSVRHSCVRYLELKPQTSRQSRWSIMNTSCHNVQVLNYRSMLSACFHDLPCSVSNQEVPPTSQVDRSLPSRILVSLSSDRQRKRKQTSNVTALVCKAAKPPRESSQRTWLSAMARTSKSQHVRPTEAKRELRP